MQEPTSQSPFDPQKGDLVRVYQESGGFTTGVFVRYNRAGKPVVIPTGRKREKAYNKVYPVNDAKRVAERGRLVLDGYNDTSKPTKQRRRK